MYSLSRWACFHAEIVLSDVHWMRHYSKPHPPWHTPSACCLAAQGRLSPSVVFINEPAIHGITCFFLLRLSSLKWTCLFLLGRSDERTYIIHCHSAAVCRYLCGFICRKLTLLCFQRETCDAAILIDSPPIFSKGESIHGHFVHQNKCRHFAAGDGFIR